MSNFQRVISQYLSDDGTTSGTVNITGDYSSVSDLFYIQPAAGDEYVITRIIGSIEDTTGMSVEEYGNLGSALTNGMVLRYVSDSKGTTNLTQDAVKTNAGWGQYCYDVSFQSWGAGNEQVLFRWTFTRAGVEGIFLDGDDNGKLEILAQDNLTGLVTHKFLVQGYDKSSTQ